MGLVDGGARSIMYRQSAKYYCAGEEVWAYDEVGFRVVFCFLVSRHMVNAVALPLDMSYIWPLTLSSVLILFSFSLPPISEITTASICSFSPSVVPFYDLDFYLYFYFTTLLHT
jgi:hypothetical protein